MLEPLSHVDVGLSLQIPLIYEMQKSIYLIKIVLIMWEVDSF